MPESRPPAADLLADVAELLRERLLPTLQGELRFQALVALTVLGQVERELRLAPAQREAERRRLAALLGRDGGLEELNRLLARRLRDGALSLDDPALQAHLRAATAEALAINSPRWRNEP
jgi:hypothetical protein